MNTHKHIYIYTHTCCYDLVKANFSLPYLKELVSGSISILNLMEVVTEKTDSQSIGVGASAYFRSLGQQSFHGPLVGGNVGTKELNKWIDERITNCESPDMDYRNGEVLRLLLSLLKIACQHYGKLRSPIGADTMRVNLIYLYFLFGLQSHISFQYMLQFH